MPRTLTCRSRVLAQLAHVVAVDAQAGEGQAALVAGLVGGTEIEEARAVGQLHYGEDVRVDADVAVGVFGGFLVGDLWHA
jgi:hypothetical protein